MLREKVSIPVLAGAALAKGSSLIRLVSVMRTHGATIVVGLLCAAFLGHLGVGPEVRAQPDSVRTAILEAKGYPPDHSPRGALWRAAAVPGWGQAYNRQYYKIPFVYAGLAGGGFAIYELNRLYSLYRHAHLFVVGRQRASENNGVNPYGEHEGEYNRVTERVGGDLGERQLRQSRDKFRRWRELSIVGTGLFYALTILDAYVSAHLLTFDVGEDLSLDVRPTGALQGIGRQISSGPPFRDGTSNGTGLRIRLQF